MKICLVANDYVDQFPLKGYGGIEVCVKTLADAMHERGLDFFVIAPKHSEGGADYPYRIIRTKGGPTSKTGKSPSFFAWEARSIIEKEKPDVIWSQSNWSADALWDLQIPMICTFHDACHKMYGWIKKYPRVKYRFLSEFSYNNWVTEDWEKKISFMQYSGLADEDYVLGDFENRMTHFLWVAGLRWGIHAKGLDYAIKMANCRYYIRAFGIGDPQLEQYCEKIAKNHNHFYYGGNLERGSKHTQEFSSAMAFLMPTRTLDTFPRTVLEAMSKGTPVLGFDNGALSEMVGIDGGVIVPEDEDPLVAYDKFLTWYKSYDNMEEVHRRTFEWSKKFHVNREIERLLYESINF